MIQTAEEKDSAVTVRITRGNRRSIYGQFHGREGTVGEGRILIVRMYMHIRGSLAQLTIRLPQQLKRKMKQLRDLNWSEIIREAIEARVLIESKRRLRDKSQALRAVKRMNEIADALYLLQWPLEWSRGHKILENAPVFIVDTSVAVKWYVKEAMRDQALRVIDDFLSDRIDLQAPSLLLYELGNALRYHPGLTEAHCADAVRQTKPWDGHPRPRRFPS